MEIKLEIPDRLYNSISEFCKSNNIVIEEYMAGCISDHHYTNIYGDLNEKLVVQDKEEKEAVNNFVSKMMDNMTNEGDEEITEVVRNMDIFEMMTEEKPKKKVGRPRKKKEPEKKEEKEANVTPQQRVVKRIRTLKTS